MMQTTGQVRNGCAAVPTLVTLFLIAFAFFISCVETSPDREPHENKSTDMVYNDSSRIKRMKIIFNSPENESVSDSLKKDLYRIATNLFKHIGIKVVTPIDTETCDFTMNIDVASGEKREGFFLKLHSVNGHFLEYFGGRIYDSPNKCLPYDLRYSSYYCHISLIEAMCSILYKIGGTEPLYAAFDDLTIKNRCAIVDFLLSKRDSCSTAFMIKALKDKDSDVRSVAAAALSVIRDTRSVIPLTNLLSDPDSTVFEVSRRALQAIGDSRAVGPLLSVSYRDTKLICRTLLEIDPEFHLTKQAQKMIPGYLVALKDSNPVVRSNAAAILGMLKVCKAIPVLQKVRFYDKNAEVRDAAAGALYNLDQYHKYSGCVKKMKLAYSKASRSEDSAVREAAAYDMGVLRDQQGYELLLVLLTDEDPVVRKAAVSSLQEYDSICCMQPMYKALSDQNAEVREEVITSFKTINDSSTFQILAPYIYDSVPAVRIATVKVSRVLPDTAKLHPLYNALHDDDWNVRNWAVIALKTHKDVRAVEPLITALQDTSAVVRKSIIDALSELHDVRAVKPIIRLLDNEQNHDVRVAAIQLLGNLGDVKAVRTLIFALTDEKWDIKYNAVSALGTLKDKEAIKPLFKIALNDTIKRIRDEAAHAIDNIDKNWADNSGVIASVLPIIDSAFNSANKTIRLNALHFLSAMNFVDAVEMLVLALADDDEEIRREAQDALDRKGYNWKETSRVERIVSKLTAEIKNSDPALRKRAIRIIDKVDYSKGFELGVKMVHDPDPDVCIAALEALAGERDSSIVGILLPFLDNKNTEVRKAALQASTNLYRYSPVRQKVLTIIASDTSEIRALAIKITRDYIIRRYDSIDDYFDINPNFALWSEQCKTIMFKLIESPDPEIRTSAIDILVNLKDQRIVAHLSKMLCYTNFNMLRSVSRSLAKAGAVDTLFKMLYHTDPEMHEAAMDGLHLWIYSHPPQASFNVSPLLFALTNDNFEVRRKAEELLNRINPQWKNTEEATDMILTLVETSLHNDNLETREIAITLLGKIGHPFAIKALVPLLQDENDRIRSMAVYALGEVKSLFAVEPLLKILISSSGINYSVIEALTKINPAWKSSHEAKKMIPVYFKSLKNENPGIRRAAAEALGVLGDERVVKKLISVIQKRKNEECEAACIALGLLKNQVAVEPLCRLIDRGFASREAVIALGKIGGERALDKLSVLQNNKDYSLRSSATQVLKEMKFP